MSRILISWSSGKDSAWTLHTLRQQGAEVGGLLVTVNESVERVAMHASRLDLVEAQAHAAGLPLQIVRIPHRCSNEIYEQRMREALRLALAAGYDRVAFGDLFLEDVRRYREERLAGTGLTPIFPLWQRPTEALAREMLGAGVRAKLTCVDPRVLDRSFAGREYDRALLDAMPAGVDPCGERGEFHTFVYEGPMFSEPIPVTVGEIVEREGFLFADICKAPPVSNW